MLFGDDAAASGPDETTQPRCAIGISSASSVWAETRFSDTPSGRDRRRIIAGYPSTLFALLVAADIDFIDRVVGAVVASRRGAVALSSADGEPSPRSLGVGHRGR